MTDRDILHALHKVTQHIQCGETLPRDAYLDLDGLKIDFATMTVQNLTDLIRHYTDREIQRAMREPPRPIFLEPGKAYEFRSEVDS